MSVGLRKQIIKIPALLSRFLFWREKQQPVQKIQRRKALSTENQTELEKLCAQLFKQKDALTSGRLQFIGLAKIQKRLGKRWASLSKIVFDTADSVIDEYTGKGDIFIRYKDDTYVMIFAQASVEEGKVKAALIASEIQRRLFELDEEELKDIEIRKAISEIKTNFIEDGGFTDFLDGFTAEEIPYEDDALLAREEKFSLFDAPVTDVDAQDYKAKTIKQSEISVLPENIRFSYLPLWDVPRNALTAYLCMGCAVTSQNNLLEAHKDLYKKLAANQRVDLDIKALKHVMAELKAMEENGRKLLIACAVHYDTLYRFEDYERYKTVLEQIPAAHKQFLVFLIMNMMEGRPPKNAYWFAQPLKGFCRHVFAEAPLRRDVNFRYLYNTGVDVVGVRLDKTAASEQEMIAILNGFSAKAKAVKIPKTFVLGISSLSLTTSAVCAGFDFLGGPAIHEAVAQPDTIHRYRHQDLIAGLLSKP